MQVIDIYLVVANKFGETNFGSDHWKCKFENQAFMHNKTKQILVQNVLEVTIGETLGRRQQTLPSLPSYVYREQQTPNPSLFMCMGNNRNTIHPLLC